MLQEWDLWYPKGGATGISFARGRCDPTEVMLVHAMPEYVTVIVREMESGQIVAQGIDLKMTAETPMARLTRHGYKIERVDVWPVAMDVGKPVLLPGGEIGILMHWWNADDHSEWRWQIELYNHR